jgi:hypothetical protein
LVCWTTGIRVGRGINITLKKGVVWVLFLKILTKGKDYEKTNISKRDIGEYN